MWLQLNFVIARLKIEIVPDFVELLELMMRSRNFAHIVEINIICKMWSLSLFKFERYLLWPLIMDMLWNFTKNLYLKLKAKNREEKKVSKQLRKEFFSNFLGAESWKLFRSFLNCLILVCCCRVWTEISRVRFSCCNSREQRNVRKERNFVSCYGRNEA